MSIRWRLVICGLELIALVLVAYLESGVFLSAKPWFSAGLALIVNVLVVEPYFPKPSDVVANTITFLLFATTATFAQTATAWEVGQFTALTFLALAILALVGGRSTGRVVALANSARAIAQVASARVIYSGMFLLSVLEEHGTLDREFWVLIGGWCVILLLSAINWQSVWAATSGAADFCLAEGMVGPSTLLVSGPAIPSVGTTVVLQAGRKTLVGVVTQRVRRKGDTWGAINADSIDECEVAVAAASLTIAAVRGGARGDREHIVGTVDAGTTDRMIRFTAMVPLQVGQVVFLNTAGMEILYQISSALVEKMEVRSGSRLIVRTTAVQIGWYERKVLRIRDFAWVPPLASRILAGAALPPSAGYNVPEGSLVLGHVIGTDVPILFDLNKAKEGHVVILGMTKMGKSTLATRLARELAKSSCVVLLDQTGEYVGKNGLPKCDGAWTGNQLGVTVFEPKPGEIAADRALSCLETIVNLGKAEYAAGNPMSRVVIIEEAHQFVPEPAGMGFNSPGRDSSIKIGTLLMQVRKYGVCVILISQRTAVVSKSALSQCENVIAFRSVDKTGIDYLEGIVGGEVSELLPKLQHAQALAFGPAMSCTSASVISVQK